MVICMEIYNDQLGLDKDQSVQADSELTLVPREVVRGCTS
jgi:hypothetical protein